jgi:hypothetical protein
LQFIAEDPVHVVVRNESPAIVDARSGGVITQKQRRVFAKFSRGTAPRWAAELGVATFEFRRRPEGVTPEQWLAFYDSIEDQGGRGWTDEEREAIEAKLQSTDGVLLVEKPKLAAPWPSYPKLLASKAPGPTRKQIADKITATVEELELDPRDVIGYELENKNRPEVLSALEALIPGHDAAPAETGDSFEDELIEA